jgi:hypothetical protein
MVRKVQDMMKDTILQMGRTGKMIPRYAFRKPFPVRIPVRSEWERGSIPIKKG